MAKKNCFKILIFRRRQQKCSHVAKLLRFFNIIYRWKINSCVAGQFVYYFEDKRAKIIRRRRYIFEEIEGGL